VHSEILACINSGNGVEIHPVELVVNKGRLIYSKCVTGCESRPEWGAVYICAKEMMKPLGCAWAVGAVASSSEAESR
jgi:hypothetical protein